MRKTFICYNLRHLFLMLAFSFCFSIMSYAQDGKVIQGVVLDEQNNPIIGASVVVINTTNGGVTDIDGVFIFNVDKIPTTIRVTYIGYETQTVDVQNNAKLTIVLKESLQALDEVVVVGYGQQKKASMVGSVQSIRASELKTPSSNLSTSFAGRMAGVIAVQRSGEPGADGANFWIRGISTFQQTSPLIIIDGIQSTQSDLNALAPEVIESFSVLKDATATALYGIRGANGVMIVETKSGMAADKPSVNIRFDATYNNPTYTPKLADGVTYMELYNESIRTRGITDVVPYTQDKIEGTRQGGNPYVYPNVNWYNEMFKSGTFSQNLNVNVRGGGSKVTYFSNFAFNNDDGMLRKTNDFSYNNNINVKRYTFQNNIDVNLTKTTKASMRLNVRLSDYNGPRVGTGSLFGLSHSTNPVDFPIRYPNDADYMNYEDDVNYIRWGGKPGGAYNNGYQNPYAEMVTGYSESFESTLNTGLSIEQDLGSLLPGLKASGLISFRNSNYSKTSRWSGYNQYEVNSYDNDGLGGVSNVQLRRVGSELSTILSTGNESSGDRRIYMQAMMNYDKTIANDHNISAMLVYNQDELSINNPSGLIQSLPQRKQGIAGRFTYSYDYKYLIEANFGYNGSDNFAKGNRFGFFPSIGLGYNISREKFFTPLSNIITNLKLRATWGLVGNDRINDNTRYLYLSDIVLQDGNFSYQTGRTSLFYAAGPKYIRFANPNTTWEVGEKLNVGFDLLLINKLNIMIDFFNETRSDIFMQRRSVADLLGTQPYDRWSNFTSTVFGNLGKVKNNGLDFSIDYDHQVNKDFFINGKIRFTYAHNEVLAYDEPSFLEYPNLSQVGHSLNQPLVYMAERLFIDDAEVANSPEQKLGGMKVTAGDLKYKDIPNAEGVLDGQIDGNDMVYSGYSTVPEIVYGFGLSTQYKKWDASIFFQGADRVSIQMRGFHPFGTDGINNFQSFIADSYWSEANPDIYAKYPRLSKKDNANNTVPSTWWLRDGKFLKLKNVELGYSFNKWRVYVSGTNLLTLTPFKEWDPEQGSGNGMFYPTQRTVLCGIQVLF